MDDLRARLRLALEKLEETDRLLHRLVNPSHTDHDRHVYLPRTALSQVALARGEIEGALSRLNAESDPMHQVLEVAAGRLLDIEHLLDAMIERRSPADPPAALSPSAGQVLDDVRSSLRAALELTPDR